MKNLYGSWVLNCALGELIGIGFAGAIAYWVNFFIGEPHSIGGKFIILIAMMFAGFIEGCVLGWFQWKVLVRRFDNLPKREWLYYTILVGVLGWCLGMLPSLFIPQVQPEPNQVSSSFDFSNPFIFASLSIVSGLLLGAIFGIFQWFSLRKYVQKAQKWILANSLGWGVGLGWIYLFASIPTEESSITFTLLMGVIGGILAGLSVGAITGIYLIKFKAKF